MKVAAYEKLGQLAAEILVQHPARVGPRTFIRWAQAIVDASPRAAEVLVGYTEIEAEEMMEGETDQAAIENYGVDYFSGIAKRIVENS